MLVNTTIFSLGAKSFAFVHLQLGCATCKLEFACSIHIFCSTKSQINPHRFHLSPGTILESSYDSFVTNNYIGIFIWFSVIKKIACRTKLESTAMWIVFHHLNAQLYWKHSILCLALTHLDMYMMLRASPMECQTRVAMPNFGIWVKNCSPMECYLWWHIWQMLNLVANLSPSIENVKFDTWLLLVGVIVLNFIVSKLFKMLCYELQSMMMMTKGSCSIRNSIIQYKSEAQSLKYTIFTVCNE